MIPVTVEFMQALRYSHTIDSRLVLTNGKTVVSGPEGVPITGGSISADRAQQARRTLRSCEIAVWPWEDLPINAISSRIQVWSGIDIGYSPMMVPAGVFRVDSISRTNRGGLSISGTSLEIYVIEDEFDTPRTIAPGADILATIQDLIKQSLPDAEFEKFSPEVIASNTKMPYTLMEERDRWAVIESLAFIISCDVYVAPSGLFRIAKRPRIKDTQPVARVNEGPDGVLIGLNTSSSRDETYNAVLAMSQSTDPDSAPYSSIVRDTDPTSPTRWGGPFGKRTFVYENALLTSTAACKAKAAELLEEKIAETRTLDFTAIPNPALEPDDIVQVSMLDGTVEDHLITQYTIPLGFGEWSASTLSAKHLDTLNPNSPLDPYVPNP